MIIKSNTKRKEVKDMVDNIEFEEAQKRLKKYSQEHLLSRYEYLDDDKKEKIIEQIKNIDFEQAMELFNVTNKSKAIDEQITNIEYVDKSKLSKDEYNKYYSIGAKEINEGTINEEIYSLVAHIKG